MQASRSTETRRRGVRIKAFLGNIDEYSLASLFAGGLHTEHACLSKPNKHPAFFQKIVSESKQIRVGERRGLELKKRCEFGRVSFPERCVRTIRFVGRPPARG